MNCPLCTKESERKFKQNGFWIRACLDCRHHFAELDNESGHIERVYSDNYFNSGGAGYANYLSEERLLKARGYWYAKKLAKYAKAGTMFDVGAAAGFFLKGMCENGWSGKGVEPNDLMANHARENLKLEISTGAFEKIETDEAFDLVSMIQVVAHFIDPMTAFRVAEKITRQNGLLLIETWNRESLSAKLWGKHWHEWSPPSVLHWFTPDSLKRTLESFGFTEIKRGRPSKWLEASHAKSLLKYRLKAMPLSSITTKTLNLIPDNISLPYPAEDLFYAVYRKG